MGTNIGTHYIPLGCLETTVKVYTTREDIAIELVLITQ